MKNEALTNVKRSEAALRQAYLDAGGKIGDGRNHNSCPFCGDSSAFSLAVDQAGNACWTCYRGTGACAPAPGHKTGGTIVDLIMRARSLSSAEACKVAVERYGQPGAQTPQAPAKRKEGKLHLMPGLAFDAYAWGLSQRQDIREPKLVKVWKYTDAQGEPVLQVGRYDVQKVHQDGTTSKKKEFVPIRRDGQGWRIGLGPLGKGGRPIPVYNCPAVDAGGDTLDVAEGEKCADALAELGLVATTSQGGSGRARETDWTPAAKWGRVRIWLDADAPGEEYAKTVAELIAAAAGGGEGGGPRITLVDLRPAGLADGQDVFDLVEGERLEGKTPEETRAYLECLANKHGKDWAPAAPDTLPEDSTPAAGRAAIGPAPRGDAERPVITNFRAEIVERVVNGKQVTETKYHALTAEQVRKSVCDGIGGQIRVLNSPGGKDPILFALTHSGVAWLTCPKDLEAFCSEHAIVRFNSRQDCTRANYVTWTELFRNFALSEYVERFIGVELFPHWPRMPGHCYLWEPPADYPTPDGRYLLEAVRLFDQISSKACAAVFAASIVSVFWGGPGGERAAFAFTADERGSGKGKASELLGAICGGIIESQLNERSEERLTQRLLHPASLTKRVIRFDNLKGVGDSELLEAQITQPMISGHRLGFGQAERENNLVVTITANELRLSPDMARRVFFVHLNKPKSFPPSWNYRMRELIGAKAAHIAADCGMILQQAQPPADFDCGTETMTLWTFEVVARVCACPALAPILGGLTVSDVLRANNRLRYDCDEELAEAAEFAEGYVDELCNELKFCSENEQGDRWIQVEDRNRVQVFTEAGPAAAAIGEIFRTTDELAEYYKKIFNRRDCNGRWWGRKLAGHIKGGRISHFRPGKDKTRGRRGFFLTSQAFLDRFERFLGGTAAHAVEAETTSLTS